MKIGLIGIDSYKNEDHFLLIKEALEDNLSGIFSPNREEILPISKSYGIKLFSSSNELFENTDIIYFARSLKPNYDFALKALKNSCHLFIEDISALLMDEVKYLYKVASEARTNIQIKLTQSFSSEFIKLPDYIHEPKLIELTNSYTYPLRNAEYFNAVFSNLYLADQFINSGIKKISILAIPLDHNHFSLVSAHIDYDNGSIISLKFENIAIEAKCSCVFYQPDRVITIDLLKHFMFEQRLDKGNTVRHEIDVKENNALYDEIAYFIDLCKNSNPHNISESPKIFKLIKATHNIIDHLSNTNNNL